MNALAFVYNPRAVVLLSPKRWPKLAAPVYADDTRHKAMAVSVLRGIETLDREPVHACDITAEQARDIGAWLTLSSPSAATTPLSLVAGGLEPDYASEQSPVSNEELRDGFDLKYGG